MFELVKMCEENSMKTNLNFYGKECEATAGNPRK